MLITIEYSDQINSNYMKIYIMNETVDHTFFECPANNHSQGKQIIEPPYITRDIT